jgi:predicted oxidoreductase
MKTYKIPNTDLTVSRLGYGTTSLIDWNDDPIRPDDVTHAARLIHAAREQGITLFDHADLYAFGKCEQVFGRVLKTSPSLRDAIVMQSKCGQLFPPGWQAGQPIRVDLSRAHILSAVEGSLHRLGTDRLDILLLHAPDALVEPEEVAEAFDTLHSAGKVRYFGVSNHNAAQIALLKTAVRQPIVVNQIQLSLAHPDPLAEGMEFTLQLSKPAGDDEQVVGPAGTGTVDYCRRNQIQIQAWSPLRGLLKLQPVMNVLARLAKEKDTTPAVLALAWLLRHPARIVPIIGGGNVRHIAENCAADGITLTRDEWYDLLVAATDKGKIVESPVHI